MQFLSKIGIFLPVVVLYIKILSDTTNPELVACKISTLNLSYGTCHGLWNFPSIALMEYFHLEKLLTLEAI